MLRATLFGCIGGILAVAMLHLAFELRYGSRSACIAAAEEIVARRPAAEAAVDPDGEGAVVAMARRVLVEGGELDCYRLAIRGLADGGSDGFAAYLSPAPATTP